MLKKVLEEVNFVEIMDSLDTESCKFLSFQISQVNPFFFFDSLITFFHSSLKIVFGVV